MYQGLRKENEKKRRENENKRKEKKTDAGVEPSAMMIELGHTVIARTAML